MPQLLSKKILVVEDTSDLREMLGRVLAARGWDPILAESGQKALDRLERETPNVILMDMQMPDMNGIQLATILKKHPVYRSIPILAVTAFPDHIARQHCLAAGCNDFISKPFSLATLETSLFSLVSGEALNTIAATGPTEFVSNRKGKFARSRPTIKSVLTRVRAAFSIDRGMAESRFPVKITTAR